MIVVDEADKLCSGSDAVSVLEIRNGIQKKIGSNPLQALLFSATFPADEENDPVWIFANNICPKAIRIRKRNEGEKDTVGEAFPPQRNVKHFWFDLRDQYRGGDRKNPDHKLKLLDDILGLVDVEKAIFFSNTKDMVDVTNTYLAGKGYVIGKTHGGLAKDLRSKAMIQMKNNEIQVIVPTVVYPVPCVLV
jgi:superfamily II DNA/RNA helicase